MMSWLLILSFYFFSTNSTSCCDWNERLIPVQFKSEGYFLYNKVPVDVCQLVWSAAICLH